MSTTNEDLGKALGQNQISPQEKPYKEDRKRDLSIAGKSAVSTFENYVKEMGSENTISEDKAIRLQVGLFKAIISTINRNTEDFNRTWSQLLYSFNQNKEGVFSERYLYRYMHNITLSNSEMKSFRMITDLMRQTASVNDRSIALKLIDLDKVLQSPVTPEGRQRVMNYYAQYR